MDGLNIRTDAQGMPSDASAIKAGKFYSYDYERSLRGLYGAVIRETGTDRLKALQIVVNDEMQQTSSLRLRADRDTAHAVMYVQRILERTQHAQEVMEKLVQQIFDLSVTIRHGGAHVKHAGRQMMIERHMLTLQTWDIILSHYEDEVRRIENRLKEGL